MKHKQVSNPKRGAQKHVLAYGVLGVIVLTTIGGLLITRSFFSNEEVVAALASETHFHGIAVDPRDPSRLYLATHHGLFVVDAAGQVRLVSGTLDDFMGFTPHPVDPTILYASGHPAGGGNTGFITSDDGGRSWRKLSDGAGGPVDFHQMDVSKADPKVIYGVYGDIQKSTDGGQSWKIIAPAPVGLIDLAAGSSPNTLYAATQQGLLGSTDDGKSWKPAYRSPQPVTMVEVTNSGEIYAFVVGTGLVRGGEQSLDWKVVGGGFSGQHVMHLSVAPTDDRRAYAVMFNAADRSQSLAISSDGGESWAALGGS